MPVLIPLSQERFAIVDDEDADLLAFKWSAWAHRKTFYARRTINRPDGRQTSQLLHRVIAGRVGITGQVDHRSRHGLDCTRGNLREATRVQNNANQGLRADNTSGVKGVSWERRPGKWRAEVSVNGKNRRLGLFVNLADADVVVRAAREALHGEFVCHGAAAPRQPVK